MANLVYRRTFTVEWGHCDPAGIVFNSRFFEFFDWSSWLLFEQALGVRPGDLGSTFGIVGIPLVDPRPAFSSPRISMTSPTSPPKSARSGGRVSM